MARFVALADAPALVLSFVAPRERNARMANASRKICAQSVTGGAFMFDVTVVAVNRVAALTVASTVIGACMDSADIRVPGIIISASLVTKVTVAMELAFS